MNDIEKRLLQMEVQINLLSTVVAYICVTTVPQKSIDEFMEGLFAPLPAPTPEGTEAIDKAREAFLAHLEVHRKIKASRR